MTIWSTLGEFRKFHRSRVDTLTAPNNLIIRLKDPANCTHYFLSEN